MERNKLSLGVNLGKAYLQRVNDDVESSCVSGLRSFVGLGSHWILGHELIVGKGILASKFFYLFVAHDGEEELSGKC